MLSTCILASGSKGNSIYLSDGATTVLVDAGLTGVMLRQRLAIRGLAPERIDAIIVSHEHADHIHGVGVLARRYQIPVYLSPATESAASPRLGALPQRRHFECGVPFTIGSLKIHPFSTSHDASDSAGFTIASGCAKVGIATDLGHVTAVVKNHLAACDILIIEANHDPGMLMDGPYPWPLKQRVKGRTGHLSNDDSVSLLADVLHDRLQHVILAHLSETNNTPQKAVQAVQRLLKPAGVPFTVAGQHQPSPIISTA